MLNDRFNELYSRVHEGVAGFSGPRPVFNITLGANQEFEVRKVQLDGDFTLEQLEELVGIFRELGKERVEQGKSCMVGEV